MSDKYEFSYQSWRQKVVLFVVKSLVLLIMAQSLHGLGWDATATLDDKLQFTSSILISVWIYANLLNVKIEIQELFVPPINILHAKEFMVAGAILSTYVQGKLIMAILST